MNPLQEYTRRRERWNREQARFHRAFIQTGNWRLATGIAAVVVAGFAFGAHAISAWWLVAPLAVFIVLAVRIHRAARGRTTAERAIRYYDQGLARLTDQWRGTGSRGEKFRDPDHVYADDLDLFGDGSMFELLSRARTAAGEQRLANWLLAPATRDEVRLRQEAVSELIPVLGLREETALLGEDLPSRIDEESVAKWGAEPSLKAPWWIRLFALSLAMGALFTLVALYAHVLPAWPFLCILACNFALSFALRERVDRILAALESSGRDLTLFSLLLSTLELQQFQSRKLRELRAKLDVKGVRASRRIARLARWIDMVDSTDHVLVRILRPVILWREQIAFGIEAWRNESGRFVGGWIHAISEIEALISFASIAFERPNWTLPQLDETVEAHFEAAELRHPLLSDARCVPNDVAVCDAPRLLIVSGSNMSGKSTLLRSVGLNAVLAWAGAPVAAQKLRISQLNVGASIRLTDSLQDNRSRFFAEITRIRQIVDQAGTGIPVLFLLDELLSGTNSHDRRIGAAGIVRGLIERGAIGLVTTHDLALAHLEEDLGGAVANVHFEDQISNGEMTFDYRLKPGVVKRSNALELMRIVGLEV